MKETLNIITTNKTSIMKFRIILLGLAVFISIQSSTVQGQTWNAPLQSGGILYLPGNPGYPTTLTGTRDFNSTTAVGPGVTDVNGTARLTTSTSTEEYYIPYAISPTTTNQRAQLLAYTAAAFTYKADSVLELRQSNVNNFSNKFVVWGLNSSRTIAFRFQVQFGSTSPVDSAAMYALSFGREDGTGSTNNFNTTNNVAPIYNNTSYLNNIFSTLKFNVSAAGVISLGYRTGDSVYSPITNLGTDQTQASYYVPFTFTKGENYDMVIMATTQSAQDYQYYAAYGTEYKLAKGYYDVWVNGTKILSGVPSLFAATGSLGLATGTSGVSINSFGFEGLTNGGSTSEFLKIRNIVWESVSGSVTVLPASWLSFTGNKKEKNAILDWTTTSEINAKSFEIERSYDGENFSTIGTVKATGSRTGVNRYNFVERDARIGVNYYRIKQVDIDNRFSYSSIITVVFNTVKGGFFVYPTVVTTRSTNIYSSEKVKDLTINLVSINGKLIQTKKIGSVEKGKLIHLPVATTNAGTYIIQFITENGVRTEKLLVQ
jgi:hypothetical protein